MNKHIISILIVLLLLSSSFIGLSYHAEKIEDTQTMDGGLMDSAWPIQCHDIYHTSRSPYSTVNTTGVEKWRFSCDWMESSVAIDDDGIIYFGDMWGNFFAMYPNGTMKWEYETNGIIWSTPAIAEDGVIYIGSWDDYLYAIYPNGTRKWRFCAHDDISSSPAIAEDGTIYFGTMLSGNNIYALNPNGTEKWHYTTGYAITSDPAIGSDGTVYIGSGDYYVYALYPNGTLRWRFQTGYYVKGSPSIAEDGTIYIGSYDDYLYALYPNNGTEKWRCKVGSGTETNPSIAEDGTIYVGDDKLYALYPNGTMRWSFNLGPNRYIHQSSPAISSEGTIYVGVCIGETSGGEIIAVNPDGTERWRKKIAQKWVESSPSIAEDGTVYIGSSYDMSGGYLHAFGRGPLVVDAGGPYSGYVDEEIQFTGTVFGGVPPYEYHWDFGDGNDSNEQNPKHAYSQAGVYTATFTVTDDEGNFSSDNATVSIEEPPPILPEVRITKPEKGLYIADKKIRSYFIKRTPLILGPITIEVDASQDEYGINRVEFYIDNEKKYTDDTEPYSWTWDTLAFFKHTIKVVAVDNTENSANVEITVMKFF